MFLYAHLVLYNLKAQLEPSIFPQGLDQTYGAHTKLSR